MTDALGAARLNVALAEYSALQQEIDRRSREQHTLLSLNLTVDAAILGTAFSGAASAHTRSVLPLVVPILSSVFAFVWLDHDHVIGRIGEYRDDILTRYVRRLVGDNKLLGWPRRGETSGHEWTARAFLTVTYGTIFSLFPVAVLVFLNPWRSWSPKPAGDPANALWGSGLALVLVALYRWFGFYWTLFGKAAADQQA